MELLFYQDLASEMRRHAKRGAPGRSQKGKYWMTGQKMYHLQHGAGQCRCPFEWHDSYFQPRVEEYMFSLRSQTWHTMCFLPEVCWHVAIQRMKYMTSDIGYRRNDVESRTETSTQNANTVS